MNTWTRIAAIGVGLTALAACGPRPISAVVMVEFEDASAAEREAAARILEARCRSLVGSPASQVTATAESGGVRSEFRGDAPTDEVVRRYVGVQGVMRIASADSPLISIVTDQDVESAIPRLGSAGPELSVVLSERAGRRMLDYTRQHRGSLLVTTLEGVEISRATIRGTFGREFQTTGFGKEMAMLQAIVLKSGRLPKPVKSVVVHHPAR